MSFRRHIVQATLTAAFALAASGCATASKPKQAPDNATPGMIALTAGDFQDTDANRLRDTTTVAAYIYAASGAYPIPMHARGSFEFRLEGRSGKQIGRWVFDVKQTEAALRQLAPGPGFVFQLSLTKIGVEQASEREAEILCTFTPVGGTPIRARPSAPLLIGPLSRDGLRG